MILTSARVLHLAIGLACAASLVRAAPQPGVEVVTTDPVSAAVMSANGRYVAWAPHSGHSLLVWDRQTSTTRQVLPPKLHPPGATVTAGVQAIFAVSDDGRYVAYQVGYSGLYSYALRARIDLDDGTVMELDGWTPSPSLPQLLGTPGVAMSRDGGTLAWISVRVGPKALLAASVMAITPASVLPRQIGSTCIMRASLYAALCAASPAVSGDGHWIFYTAGDTVPAALAAYDVASAVHAMYPEVLPRSANWDQTPPIASTLDGRHVVARTGASGPPFAVVFDRDQRLVDRADAVGTSHVPRVVSDDGLVLLLEASAPGVPGGVLDRRSGLVIQFPDQTLHAMSADGAAVLGSTESDLRVTSLDADADGMLDGWEQRFGLDPTTAADAGADADGDGRTNLQEFVDRTHPTANAAFTRLLAEGAAGSFFDTVVSLFNPGAEAADALVRFMGPAGTAASQVVRLEPGGRQDVASCCVGLLAATEFGVIVESTRLVVVDRRVTWDRATGYGSHASAAVEAPALEWYFAEGATIGGLQTFFLLQNPGTTPATVTIDFLLADTTTSRSYVVDAGARRTVWVNQEGAPLSQSEFAATVRASAPIVAERAMYRDRPGQMFAAGTNAIGVTAPATTWRFAEGATGPFFDTFVLMANPGDAPVQVAARFDLVTRTGQAATLTRTYDVAPRSRFTIWLDAADPLLADAEVVTTLEASAPIVAERAMWWAGDAESWVEGHVEFGATVAGTRFAVADAETFVGADTFLLVGTADPGGALPALRVTAYQGGRAPIVGDVAAAAGRTTIWMRQTFPDLWGRFSVVVESLGGVAAVPIVVERATYGGDFAAGAAARATMVPE